MKLKSLLGTLLFVHVLVHPVAHVLPLVGAVSPEAQPLTRGSPTGTESATLGPCLGCRTGSSLIAARAASPAVPLQPFWEKPLPAPSPRIPEGLHLQVLARAPPLA